MDIKDAIKRVSKRRDLTEKEMRSVFSVIMSGKATPAQIGSFITALAIKGETVEEITGAARVMRHRSLKVKLAGGASGVLDTCGTGGSGSNTFNISTASAFVVAGCGVKVAKHGNRSASSHCGSADVLEELGVGIDTPVKITEKAINEINVGFIFAPMYHSAMKHASYVRKEIAIRTVFNILGPLSNPASARIQVMGVYDPALTEEMANVLKNLGSKRAFVVNGHGPIDEVSIAGSTRVSELKLGKVKTYNVKPSDFGVKKRTIDCVKGGGCKVNASMLLAVLSGKEGPRRDIVLMNSSLALVAAGKARGFKEGMRIAAVSIDSGQALNKLNALIEITGASPASVKGEK